MSFPIEGLELINDLFVGKEGLPWKPKRCRLRPGDGVSLNWVRDKGEGRHHHK